LLAPLDAWIVTGAPSTQRPPFAVRENLVKPISFGASLPATAYSSTLTLPPFLARASRNGLFRGSASSGAPGIAQTAAEVPVDVSVVTTKGAFGSSVHTLFLAQKLGK
jgi:hypothetical protein